MADLTPEQRDKIRRLFVENGQQQEAEIATRFFELDNKQKGKDKPKS